MKTAFKKYDTNKETTTQTKERRTKKWQNGTETVMFVQATPNEEFKKEIQNCALKNRIHIKVREKVDNNIRRELQRSNPFKITTCGRESCIICEKDMGVDCRTRGCVYELRCEECRRKYRGQTGNSIGERTNEHFDDWKRGETSSPLHRHSELYHGGKTFPVSVKVLERCFGDATRRKITEAVLIDELSTNETMNGKAEWTYVKLNKLSTAN